MNSPYRVHPALPLQSGKTIPFPKAAEPQHPTHSSAAPVSPGAAKPNRLAQLVKLEGELRSLPTPAALAFHAVNEPRQLLDFAQGFFFRANRRGRFEIEAVSDIAVPDARAPLIAGLRSVVDRLQQPQEILAFDLNAVLKSAVYPHRAGLWLPMLDRKGTVFAGLLFTKDSQWTEDEQKIGKRLAEAYGHAFRALSPPQLLRSLSMPRWAIYGLPIVALSLAFVPVPLTTLAPFEVVPLDPYSVTAPLDGVIAEINADPNVPVEQGQLLFRFDATKQRADAEIAQQRVVVAEARLATMRNGAFSDPDMKRALSISEKELQLARAEYDYAIGMLAKTEVIAPASGLLVYSSKSDWLGKPVQVGERIMDVADPSRVAYRIDLSVSDSIALGKGARVRLFFDADPLNPREAEILEESYHATKQADGSLAYQLKAKSREPDEAPARLGLRGTAQLSGEKVSLGFFLFRRPIAALRQHFGF